MEKQEENPVVTVPEEEVKLTVSEPLIDEGETNELVEVAEPADSSEHSEASGDDVQESVTEAPEYSRTAKPRNERSRRRKEEELFGDADFDQET